MKKYIVTWRWIKEYACDYAKRYQDVERNQCSIDERVKCTEETCLLVGELKEVRKNDL